MYAERHALTITYKMYLYQRERERERGERERERERERDGWGRKGGRDSLREGGHVCKPASQYDTTVHNR